MFYGANCIEVQKLMQCWFLWRGTGHHPHVDFISLSTGVPPPALIRWRLESSCRSSGLNQSPIKTCHLKLIGAIAFCRPTGAAVIVYTPQHIEHPSGGRNSLLSMRIENEIRWSSWKVPSCFTPAQRRLVVFSSCRILKGLNVNLEHTTWSNISNSFVWLCVVFSPWLESHFDHHWSVLKVFPLIFSLWFFTNIRNLCCFPGQNPTEH